MFEELLVEQDEDYDVEYDDFGDIEICYDMY